MSTSISADIVGGSGEGLTNNMSEAAITEFHRQKTGGQFLEQQQKKKTFDLSGGLDMWQNPVVSYSAKPQTFSEASSTVDEQLVAAAQMYNRGDLSADFYDFTDPEAVQRYEYIMDGRRHDEAVA